MIPTKLKSKELQLSKGLKRICVYRGLKSPLYIFVIKMSDEKLEDPQTDLSIATESLKIEDKDNGDTAKSDKVKIDILLKATGNAPIMKKKKWAVDAEKPIGWIVEFVKKYLKLEPDEKLFLYVNQTFAPSPDQIVRNLYECFGTDGKLVLHYCKSQAWG